MGFCARRRKAIEFPRKMFLKEPMRIKLAYKLFGAFFLILAIVVGAVLFARHLFFLNFHNYIRQVEIEKLRSLVPALQTEYRANHGWEGLRSDLAHWQRVIGVLSDLMKATPGQVDPEPAPVNEEAAPQQASPLKVLPRGGPPGVLLMDDRRRPIIGIPGDEDRQQLVAIEVDGQIVGWLGLEKHTPFKSGAPPDWLESQARQLYLLAGTVILLTALIAFFLSRHLLGPVQRLARGTRDLANRDFSVRIAPTTADELGQLAENFNTMAQTLDQYESMRRQWLTDISHELRTPLAILRGEIEALQDGVRPPTPDNLASLHAEILRIGKLVDDLHLLSLAESDMLHLNPRPISPASVLQGAAENHRPHLAQGRIKLELGLEEVLALRIKADADRLEQVFANLMENAGKYIQPPGILRITGRAGTDGLTLRFEDSGPGVPAEALPRLFDRLYRVENSRNRVSGGSGLGLSICKHIVESHGGRIWAEASALGGLCIAIRLPLTPKFNA